MAETGMAFQSKRPVGPRIAKVVRSIRRLPIVPALLLSLVLVTGIAAPWISPHNPTKQSLRDRNLPPAWEGPGIASKTVVQEPEIGKTHTQIALAEARELEADIALGDTIEVVNREGGSTKYLLGTDGLGRDILTRTIYGARISLILAAITLGIGGTVGVILGLLAGWYGRLVDELIMRLVDVELALPLILVALVMVVALGQSLTVLGIPWTLVVILAIWIWPRFARIVRGEVLRLKTMDYVALAQVAGASTSRLMFFHLLPGTFNTVIVVATLQVGVVILAEASLSFLGAGVPEPEPAWGSMVADGRDKLAIAWWISTIPGLAIVLTVMSMNLFGDWLRDTLDPRLRQLE